MREYTTRLQWDPPSLEPMLLLSKKKITSFLPASSGSKNIWVLVSPSLTICVVITIIIVIIIIWRSSTFDDCWQWESGFSWIFRSRCIWGTWRWCGRSAHLLEIQNWNESYVEKKRKRIRVVLQSCDRRRDNQWKFCSRCSSRTSHHHQTLL